MSSPTHEPIKLSPEELAILVELLESERTRLLVGIRHTDHRVYRDALRHRLTLVEDMAGRYASHPENAVPGGPQS